MKYYHKGMLPTNLQKFACRYLIYSLAKASNLKQWEIKSNTECQLCRRNETQFHLFNNCKTAFPRYRLRHDFILKTLSCHLQFIQPPFTRLFIDIKGFENPAILFKRPEINSEILHRAMTDIVKQNKNITTAIELTCPFESNLIKSDLYKQKRQEKLKSKLLTPALHFSILLLEISSLRFVDHETNKIYKHFNKHV